MTQALLELVGPITTAAAAAILGYPLARYWQERQKRREIALATTAQFYKVYGDFARIWKSWNHSLLPAPSENTVDAEQIRTLRTGFLSEITRAQADLESIILKVACERELADHEAEALAKYRQGYQQLANAIKNYTRLAWDTREHPQYIVYKEAAVAFAYILSTLEVVKRPTPRGMMVSMSLITAEQWRESEVWCTPLSKLPKRIKRFTLGEANYNSDAIWLLSTPRTQSSEARESVPQLARAAAVDG